MSFYLINQVPASIIDQHSVEETWAQLSDARDNVLVNTLAIALDVLSKAQNSKAPSKLTLKEMSSPEVLIKKYRGAGLFQIAAWLKEQADKKGIAVHLVAESVKGSTIGTLPQAIEKPAGKFVVLMDDICSQEVPNYCDLIVHYNYDGKNDMGFIWKLGNPMASRKCKPLSWNVLTETFQKVHNGATLRGIKDPSIAQANWMSYAWQLTICDWMPNGKKFTYNLISGELKLEGSLSNAELPSLVEDKIILSGDICTGEEAQNKGFYFLNGKKIEMTHEEAFGRLASNVCELFQQPETFVEEMKALVKNRKTYIDAVMQPVFSRLIRVWPEYKECQTLQKQAQVLAEKYMPSKPDSLKEADIAYDKSLKQLVVDKELTGSEFKEAIKLYGLALGLISKQTAIPLQLLLDDVIC